MIVEIREIVALSAARDPACGGARDQTERFAAQARFRTRRTEPVAMRVPVAQRGLSAAHGAGSGKGQEPA
jgi:hypothetical protein